MKIAPNPTLPYIVAARTSATTLALGICVWFVGFVTRAGRFN